MKILDWALLQFYLGQRTDSAGRMIDDILVWDDNLLEDTHDYIQWLFPLRERSAYNATAPLLDEACVQAFRSNEELRTRLKSSFSVLLKFYGFTRKEENGQVVVSRTDAFFRKAENWLTPHNHNFLRITRILKCLTTLGLPQDAAAFEKALEEVYGEYEAIIGKETLRYWREAVFSL